MDPIIALVRGYQESRTDEERERYADLLLAEVYAPLTRFIATRAAKQNREDVVQETLAGIFERLLFFEERSADAFWGWVYSIAKHKAADSFRGRKMTLSTVADPELLEEALAHLRVKGAISAADLTDLHDALDLLKASNSPCLGWLWDRYVVGLTFPQMAMEEKITEDAA